ncbi:MAG: hypothetical protein LJE96_00955, partial [Deltaproteobacteria bacterium]|nr:hypothetical protein [Deltaproteobacteria bacterium]
SLPLTVVALRLERQRSTADLTPLDPFTMQKAPQPDKKSKFERQKRKINVIHFSLTDSGGFPL